MTINRRLCRLPYQGQFADLNGDKTINASDLQLAINGNLGLDTMGFNPDVNGDCKLEANDVQTVILVILGLWEGANR